MERMTNDEMAEMIAERNGNQHYCKDCDDCCQPYDSTDDCFKSAMQAMELKDEQHAQEKQKLIDEACKWLFVNDSYAIPTNVQVDRLREHLNKIKG